MPSTDRAVLGPSLLARSAPAKGTAAAFAILGFLELFRIGRWSLWADEAFSISTSDRSWESLAKLTYRSEATGSLYAVVLRLWLHIGRSEAWLRSFSTVCVLLCVPLLYGIGRRLFDGWAGFIAVLLFVLNGSVLRYGQHIRFYAFLLLLSLAVTYCFVRETQEDGWVALRWRVGWSVGAVLMVATHLLTSPLVGALIVSKLFLPSERRRFLRSIVAATPAGVTAAAAAALLVKQRDEGRSLLTFRPLGTASDIVQTLSGSGGRLGALLLCGSTVVLAVHSRRLVMNRAHRFGAVLVVSCVVLPSTVLYAVSTVRPTLVGSCALYSTPYLCLGLGWLLSDLAVRKPRSTFQRLLVAISIVGLVGGALLGVARWARGVEVADWRTLAHDVFRNAEKGDAIVFANDSTRLYFEYYRPAAALGPVPLFPIDPWGGFETGDQRHEPFPAAAIETARDTRPRLWVVVESGLVSESFPGLTSLAGATVVRERTTSAGLVRLYDLAHATDPTQP